MIEQCRSASHCASFLSFTVSLLKRGKEKLLIIRIRNGIKTVKNGIEIIRYDQL